ncbi:MAG: hypothetical protein CMD31_12985 [Flavobacteriales bacterium]|jgi:Na+/H+-translocating membrane pyrophosphatase|nr:hypothetical protein [Flavobacteriales bacterium]|tara:strand:+ start:26331 stop:26957 length:627 start_codon:yes stop_codon:yes gene_type:complete
MSKRLNKYLIELRHKAIRFERIDINGKSSDNWFINNQRRIICSLVAIILTSLLVEGFNEQFISYSSTILSILIGLFITAMIFSFDKFYTKIDREKANANEKLWNTQSYNYSMQFAYITGYNIVLSIFTLVVLSLSVFFDVIMSINVWGYHFEFDKISADTFLNFIGLSLLLLQRFIVLYWIACIVYNTLFLVSSMVQYMTVKIDRQDD